MNGELDRTYDGSDTVDFAMSNLPEILRQRTSELFSDPIAGCFEKKPVQGAYWFLAQLETLGHELGVLTSRPEPLHEPTRYILLRDFPNINFYLGVHFANKKETCDLINAPSKRGKIKEINPDFYFDDHFDYCYQAAETVPTCRPFLVRNKHTGWNKNANLSSTTIREIRNVAFFDERLIWDTRRDRIMRRHTR